MLDWEARVFLTDFSKHAFDNFGAYDAFVRKLLFVVSFT